MKFDELGLPTIIVPYPGPSRVEGEQDIFVYLRPETNGVLVESTMLKVIKATNVKNDAMDLIYLANIPGEFMVENRIVEQYYALRMHFAVQGWAAFTPEMKKKFRDHFLVDGDSVSVLGAFPAIKKLSMEPEEMFGIWVDQEDLAVINGQVIKRIKDLYVVNYDIPALIHKNSKATDIALMIFRTKLPYAELKSIIQGMQDALRGIGIINAQYDAARAFHYSKGPFEQLMDATAYLFPASQKTIRMSDCTFGLWLEAHGVAPDLICSYLRNPIVQIKDRDGLIREDHLFSLTTGLSYAEAYNLLSSIVEQKTLIHHAPFIDGIGMGM